jgi:hypothetical protein
MLSTSSQLELTPDMGICRIVNGMWQVSGAHGRIDPAAALRNMFDYIDAGLTTWDAGACSKSSSTCWTESQTSMGQALPTWPRVSYWIARRSPP